MNKLIVVLFLLCVFVNCRQHNSHVNNISLVKNDTFVLFDKEYDIPIPVGFSTDTVIETNKKTGYTKTIVCPSLNGQEFKALNSILRKEVVNAATLSYTERKETPEDTGEEVYGATEENMPLTMYKDQSIVSFGFLSMYSDTAAMRPYRKYFTVNYDLRKSKLICFSDYFTIKTRADSLFFKQLVFGKTGNPDVSWFTLDKNISFSIDSEAVYFYFDMFGAFGNPMGLVYKFKKKYLNKFISNDYQ